MTSVRITLTDANDSPPVCESPLYRASLDEGATTFDPPLIVKARDSDTISDINYRQVFGPCGNLYKPTHHHIYLDSYNKYAYTIHEIYMIYITALSKYSSTHSNIIVMFCVYHVQEPDDDEYVPFGFGNSCNFNSKYYI